MLERIISGGQTGADRGALEAAKELGVATGGWLPRGCLTEEGVRPDLLDTYGMKECPHGGSDAACYRIRSTWNVRDADATICFALNRSDATKNAVADCAENEKPFKLVRLCMFDDRLCVTHDVNLGEMVLFPELVQWIAGFKTVNVCGNRERKAPGIREFVKAYMGSVIKELQNTYPPHP